MLTNKQTMMEHVEMANNANNQTHNEGTCRDG